MITQIFKIMWHRKGKSFLLLIEIFFSFMVLFATSTLLIKNILNYTTPPGFDYKDVYTLNMERHGEEGASALEKLKQIKRVVESFPEVQNAGFSSSNIPYSNYVNNGMAFSPEGDRSASSNYYYVEPEYFETMDMKLISGRLLEKGDIGDIKPVVINEELRTQMFRDENPLGKRMNYGEEKYEVAGVVEYFRQGGEFSAPAGAVFQLTDFDDTSSHIPSSLLIEIKSGTSGNWQPLLVEKINMIAGNWTVELDPLSALRKDQAKFILIPAIALGIVCGFLIINVAMGLFGVLWQNISRRYSEIGIRRALGATKTSVRFQIIGEVLVLASLALFGGVLLAVQFPLLGVFNVESGIYFLAIMFSLIVIYLLVAFCAWYPSRQASAIEPAEALHYE